MALLSNGTVTKLGGRGGGESNRIGPPGDSRPMVDQWAALFAGAATPEALAELTDAAQYDYDTTMRRPSRPTRPKRGKNSPRASCATDGESRPTNARGPCVARRPWSGAPG
jgi:hypothetical protein